MDEFVHREAEVLEGGGNYAELVSPLNRTQSLKTGGCGEGVLIGIKESSDNGQGIQVEILENTIVIPFEFRSVNVDFVAVAGIVP